MPERGSRLPYAAGARGASARRLAGRPVAPIAAAMQLTDPASVPYARLLGLEVEGDHWLMPPHELVMGRPGYLHGGAIAGLLEIVAYDALTKRLAADGVTSRPKPITLTINYMRGGVERATYAAAAVDRLGKRLANVDACAWQQDRDRPIAAARLTFLIER